MKKLTTHCKRQVYKIHFYPFRSKKYEHFKKFTTHFKRHERTADARTCDTAWGNSVIDMWIVHKSRGSTFDMHKTWGQCVKKLDERDVTFFNEFWDRRAIFYNLVLRDPQCPRHAIVLFFAKEVAAPFFLDKTVIIIYFLNKSTKWNTGRRIEISQYRGRSRMAQTCNRIVFPPKDWHHFFAGWISQYCENGLNGRLEKAEVVFN